jgi:hypothetical protein
MEINGVPLHPLVVHAAVVFTPLAALALIAFVALKAWRVSLRLPTLALAVVAGLSIVASYYSGKNFLETRPTLSANPLVHDHQARAGLLLWVGLAFAVVAVIAVLLAAVPARVGTNGPERAARQPAVANVFAALAVLLAVASLVLVVVVGDLGARAVWGG